MLRARCASAIKMRTYLSSVLSQCTRLTDRKTDRQTDAFVIASQRWHSTKGDITLQQSDILAMRCKVVSSFVIFTVSDLRVGGSRPL